MGTPARGRPSELYTARTFYTLGGASMAVWIFAAICGQYIGSGHLHLLRGLALVVALVISFAGAAQQKSRAFRDLLVAFFNGLLIYASATGINAVSTGTDLLRGDTTKEAKASLLPFIQEKALWPPVALVQKNEALQKEGAAQELLLQRTIKEDVRPKPVGNLDEEKILSSATGKQREVIQLAFDLYHRKIPYKWGGKDPHEGLDSSGYIAYILARVGVIQDPTTYWSGKLKAELKKVNPQQAAVGDIMFYNSGACVIYLGDKTSIWMLPGGIGTGDLEKSPDGYDLLGAATY